MMDDAQASDVQTSTDSPARRLASACTRLQGAADELENAFDRLPPGRTRDDVNEAIGMVIETLRIVAEARAKATA